jgi:hypothetical protein
MPAETLSDKDAGAMLQQGDDLTAVIRGHLRMDFLLNTAIEAAFDHPDEATLDRLSFPPKVDLRSRWESFPVRSLRLARR